MSWILTATGREVDLAHPRPGQIIFADIAHALAQLSRFTGHARRPYSVAEHSLLVCEIAEREFGLDVHGRLAALMHDAEEAYTNDISPMAKRLVGEPWHELEYRFKRLVRSCFALHVASKTHETVIKQCDLMALATERDQLLPPEGPQWALLAGVDAVGWVDLMESGRCSMTWQDWRQAFTDRYLELDFARQVRMEELTKESQQ